MLCCAPHESLVARVAERDGLPADEAERIVRQKNHEREQHARRHFGRDWLDPEHYHVVLNTGWLGIDRCVTLVCELARERLGAGNQSPRTSG